MEEHLWRVYRYRNVLTDESYIGQTTQNVSERARKGKHYKKGTKFRTAIDTYGWENFEQSILRLCTTQEDADYWEKFFIDKYDAINNGYNTCLGDGGNCILNKHHTEEACKKISEKLSGENHPMYGRTGELAPCYGRVGEKHPMYGKTGEKAPNYGKTWWNNGIISVMAYECPEGYVPGRIYQRRTI